MKLENDDIQDFDLRWVQALLLTRDRPLDKVSEGLYVLKPPDSSQAHTNMALYNHELLRGRGQRDYHRLRLCVKLHIEQAQRSKNFRIQSENYRACGRNWRKGTQFFHQAEDKRVLLVEGKWVLFKRRLL